MLFLKASSIVVLEYGRFINVHAQCVLVDTLSGVSFRYFLFKVYVEVRYPLSKQLDAPFPSDRRLQIIVV